MVKDTSLQTSPQLALVEQSRVVVALSEKQVISLFKKSQQSGIPFDTLKEVYQRGYSQSLSEQIAYNRVNSFIAGGAAMEIDQDLLEAYFSQTKPKQGFEHKGKVIGAITKMSDGYYVSRRRKDPDKKTSVNLMQKHKTREDAEKHLISKSGLGEELSEKRGLWDNIHAKRERIKNGSGEHMRKPGSKGAPTKDALKKSQTENYTGAEKVSSNSDEPSSRFAATNSLTNVYKKDTPGYTGTIKRAVKEHCGCDKEKKMVEDAKGYKNPTGGLTQKGRDHYNRESGGHLKAPVTTPPSKLKAGSKSANRRKSFCARMGGVEGPMKKPNGEPTRKALALRKWNC